MSRRRPRQWIWVDEGFGHFRVNPDILDLVDKDGLEETSHRSDVAPSFGAPLDDGSWLRLWVEHPRKSERKGSPFRYSVYIQPDLSSEPSEKIVETDDPWDAIVRIWRVLDTRAVRRRRFRLLGIHGFQGV